VVLATPEFVQTQSVQMLNQIKVSLKLKHWMLADRMVWSEEGAKFES
jgi:hypothetical protein